MQRCEESEETKALAIITIYRYNKSIVDTSQFQAEAVRGYKFISLTQVRKLMKKQKLPGRYLHLPEMAPFSGIFYFIGQFV